MGLRSVRKNLVTEKQIREIVLLELKENSVHEDSLIVEELGICQGDVRVDIAVINCSFEGIEIKSDYDDLSRLTRQQKFYNKCFDKVTVVCGVTHLDKVIECVPSWWGVRFVEMLPSGVRLRTERVECSNPDLDVRALVELLWKDEALYLLRQLGKERGYKSKCRDVIWDRLVELFKPSDLIRHTSQLLRARENWRAAC